MAENLAFLDEWEKHQEWLAQQPMQPEYDHTCDTCNVEVDGFGFDREGYEHREYGELCEGCGMSQLCEGHCLIKNGVITLSQDYWAAKEKQHFEDIADVECTVTPLHDD